MMHKKPLSKSLSEGDSPRMLPTPGADAPPHPDHAEDAEASEPANPLSSDINSAHEQPHSSRSRRSSRGGGQRSRRSQRRDDARARSHTLPQHVAGRYQGTGGGYRGRAHDGAGAFALGPRFHLAGGYPPSPFTPTYPTPAAPQFAGPSMPASYYTHPTTPVYGPGQFPPQAVAPHYNGPVPAPVPGPSHLHRPPPPPPPSLFHQYPPAYYPPPQTHYAPTTPSHNTPPSGPYAPLPGTVPQPPPPLPPPNSHTPHAYPAGQPWSAYAGPSSSGSGVPPFSDQYGPSRRRGGGNRRRRGRSNDRS